jgi:hypothetical protein
VVGIMGRAANSAANAMSRSCGVACVCMAEPP